MIKLWDSLVLQIHRPNPVFLVVVLVPGLLGKDVTVLAENMLPLLFPFPKLEMEHLVSNFMGRSKLKLVVLPTARGPHGPSHPPVLFPALTLEEQPPF